MTIFLLVRSIYYCFIYNILSVNTYLFHSEEVVAMATGTIKWFSNRKGFGFIQPTGGGEDIFVHYSSIQMDGYRSLADGEPVQYEVVDGPKGLQARNVQRGEA